MKHFTSKEIREVFLNFFKKHDHQVIKGSSIIPKKDPTLLFINSGMAPLKKYFLREETPPYPRLTNVQPCIRTNDIEDVGDRHHLTFFEMLGSWSIGDYYKEKAIALAYDLLVNHFKFPPEKLFATIYEGNRELNLGPDEEARRFWEKAGMPADHIVPKGEDNFWGPAGDTGPCGPCTEVFFDTGDGFGLAYTPGGYFDDVNRYIEIWNAGVFMELNKDKSGHYSPLPMKSVDTGSGIERMYLALNGTNSLYEVDTIQPVFNRVEQILQSDEISQREKRMVTDHMRTCTMLLGEGVLPDKDGRGYIPRRLIRKSIATAIRACQSPFDLKEVVEEVIVQMSDFYGHLNTNRDSILSALHNEINDFAPVIKSGLQMLDDKIEKIEGTTLSGEFVFDLVTTHGLPLEVITDYVNKKGLALDKEKYQEEYRKHQEISRAGLKGKSAEPDGTGQQTSIESQLAHLNKTVFTGYEKTEDTGTVIALFKENKPVDQVTSGEECLVVFDRTPFYAESGGQVGDTGNAYKPGACIRIKDTQKRKGYFLHAAIVEEGSIEAGDHLAFAVDAERRINITKNHTSTHLLHAALRSVLGDHVVQKGSLVSNEKLRFDFLHNKPVTDGELKDVESKINHWIWSNYTGNIREMNYQAAIDTGAMALFNENYGDTVRVVQFGDISAELCGGLHVKATGEIGVLLINQETSVAKGIRRIEAVSGPVAYQQITTSRDILHDVNILMASRPENLLANIDKLKKSATSKGTSNAKPATAASVEGYYHIISSDGAKVFIGQLDQDAGLVQKTADQKIATGEADIVFLASSTDGTVKALVTVSSKFQDTHKADALLKKWLEPFGGKGGGKAALAKGGIKETSSIPALVESVRSLFEI
ncbi:MAG: alanine--tRNA ligase [Chitinophagaceae bacterium]